LTFPKVLFKWVAFVMLWIQYISWLLKMRLLWLKLYWSSYSMNKRILFIIFCSFVTYNKSVIKSYQSYFFIIAWLQLLFYSLLLLPIFHFSSSLFWTIAVAFCQLPPSECSFLVIWNDILLTFKSTWMLVLALLVYVIFFQLAWFKRPFTLSFLQHRVRSQHSCPCHTPL
jgi:hypothetical protein